MEGESIALIPGEVLEKRTRAEVMELVKKNKREKKDFFYVDGIKIDILRPRI